jgi:hypothetical protein
VARPGETGTRPGGRKHQVGAVIAQAAVSLISGNRQRDRWAEFLFEVMPRCAVQSRAADAAYLVLGGDSWTLRDYSPVRSLNT